MTWVLYFLIYHCCFLGMYRLFISSGTTYQFQRIYLLLSLPLALMLALLPEYSFTFMTQVKTPVVFHEFTDWGDDQVFEMVNTISLPDNPSSWWATNWQWGYLLVSVLLLGKMIFGIGYIIRLTSMAQFEKYAAYQIFNIKNIAPFSFWKWIFLDKEQLNKQELEMVICHEKNHLVQRHTIDLSIHQIYQILFWWNPLIYLQGYWVRLNLELLADKATLKQGVDVYQYGQLMIRMATNPLLSASYFAQKPLKIRIMNLSKSPQNKVMTYITFAVVTVTIFIGLSAFKSYRNTSSAATPVAFELTQNTVMTTVDAFQPIFPIKGKSYRISSGYGERIHPILKEKKFHNGIDIVDKLSTPILAVEDGVVLESDHNDGYGHYVVIQHANGYITRYGQLESRSVDKGAQIKQGEELGLLGSSGRSTGPHLHFEIKKDNEFVDPMTFFETK